VVALAVVLLGVLAAAFWQLERRDRGIAVVAIIWGLLLVEVALYPNQSTVPAGIFHPVLGGLSFRLLDVVVPVALFARLGVHGLGRFSGSGLLWIAFAAWLAGAALIGLLNGNSASLVAFEAKAIAYLGAIYLTATIPAREYLTSRFITRLIGASAILAAVLLTTNTAGVSVDIGASLPEDSDIVSTAGEAVDPFGSVGADAATIFIALGIIALALAFNSPDPRQRARLMIAAAPLLASAIGSEQRAAYLEVAVALSLFIALIVVSKRALRTTATEVGLAAMIVAAVVLLPTLVSTATAEEAKPPPLQREIANSLSGPVEAQTTADRLNQWRTARRLIEQRPVFGWGLGKEYEYFEPGFFEFFTVDITHNIVLDLLLRTGIVGLLLFLAALGSTAYRGLRAWLELREGLVAALALGTLAAIGGLLAKGLAESVFEKYRVALVLVFLIGILISVAAASEKSEQRRPRERRSHDRRYGLPAAHA
jgi:O-antigen ligase